MRASDLGISFAAVDSDRGPDWIVAAAAIAVAVLAATAIDQALRRRGRQLAQTLVRGDLSAETDTRLRFVRRLIYALIIIAGIVVALGALGVDEVAASLLASGAIAAAVIGFAARQTLGNFVAGIMLAITQPLRVGDWVYVEDQYGVVDDVQLNYTILRTLGDQRVIIPNEKLATGILRNDTLGAGSVSLDVSIWLPIVADIGAAVTALREDTGQTVSVAETTVDGVRLTVGGAACAPPDRAARESELRLRCLQRLRAEGLLRTEE